MLPYATADDLAGTSTPGQVAWLSTDQLTALGDDTDRMMLRATELIAEHASAGYVTDATGLPVYDEIKAALRDATCAQVEQWLEVGEENDIAGYSRATSMSVGINLSSLPSILAPRARRILRMAGLLYARAW